MSIGRALSNISGNAPGGTSYVSCLLNHDNRFDMSTIPRNDIFHLPRPARAGKLPHAPENALETLESCLVVITARQATIFLASACVLDLKEGLMFENGPIMKESLSCQLWPCSKSAIEGSPTVRQCLRHCLLENSTMI